MALGNAKILYGSEKFKFYGLIALREACGCTDKYTDIVVAYSEPDAMFAAVLVCSFNEATKILRKEVAGCPLAAARAIVHSLLTDTGLLLSQSQSLLSSSLIY